MALADNPDGLSKLQKISAALAHFGDAANNFRGIQSNYGAQNLHQLQQMQRQLLFQQELQKKQARETAQTDLNNLDPNALAGIVNREAEMQGPLPAGMAEEHRPMIAGMAFDPALQTKTQTKRRQLLAASDPDAYLQAQIAREFASPQAVTTPEGGTTTILNPDGSTRTISGGQRMSDKARQMVDLYGPDWQSNPQAISHYQRATMPMAVSLSANTQGETEFSKTEGKALGEQAAEIFSGADLARQRVGLGDTFAALQENFKTGKLAPAFQNVGAWAQALGIDPATLGIPANAAMSGEAMDAISNRLTMAAIGPGGLPANNFSEADRKFAQATTVQKMNTPEANHVIRQIARSADQRAVLKEQMWIDARKKGVNFPDFKKQWSEYVEQTPAFPRVNSPEELASLQPGSLFTAPDGTIRVKAIGAPQ